MWENDLPAIKAEAAYRREQIIRDRGASNIRRRPVRRHRAARLVGWNR